MSRETIAQESLQAVQRLEHTIRHLRTVVDRALLGATPAAAGYTAALVDDCNQMLTVLLCNAGMLEGVDEVREYYVHLHVGGSELVLTKHASDLQGAQASALAYAALTFPGKSVKLKSVSERT